MQTQLRVDAIRFPQCCAIGIEPVSEQGSKRLIWAALEYAVVNDRTSVTLVHKGNIMQCIEGFFKQWGYQVVEVEFGAMLLEGSPWMHFKNPYIGQDIVIKDVLAGAFLQHSLLQPQANDVIATLNSNGDSISVALEAQVGTIDSAPEANLGERCAVFETTQGSALYAVS